MKGFAFLKWILSEFKARPDVYKSGRGLSGTTRIGFSAKKIVLYRTIRYLGATMTSFSIAALIFAYTPVTKSLIEIPKPVAESRMGEVVEEEVFVDSDVVDEGEIVRMEAEGYGVDTEFSIVISKIAVASNVIAQVDITNKDEYIPAMLKGVAHAKNTKFPGQSGVSYLFAHSTNSPIYIQKFNAVFYRLRELDIGDQIIVFYGGEKYEYKVKETKVVEVTDTEWVNNAEHIERLVLQTSHPPGTIWKRLLVIAEPV